MPGSIGVLGMSRQRLRQDGRGKLVDVLVAAFGDLGTKNFGAGIAKCFEMNADGVIVGIAGSH